MARPRKLSKPLFGFALVLLVKALGWGIAGYTQGEPNFYLISVVSVALAELVLVIGVLRYYFTFFTTVSIAGGMIGSMALVIVLSVMSGFETDLRDKILGMNAHIRITKEHGEFTEYRKLQERIAQLPDVVGTTPYLQSEVVIAANKNYSNVIIRGIDPRTIGRVTDLGKNAQQPNALQRLWPLADDGGILGPPKDAGVSDAGTDHDDAASGVDPPPEGLDIDRRDPVDFSGKVDPPPPGLDIKRDDPVDFSGGVDAGPPIDAGPDDDPEPEPPNADLDGGAPPPDPHAPPLPPPTLGPGPNLPHYPQIDPAVARLDGILVGRELKKHIHLYLNQEVQIVSPIGRITPEGAKPNVLAFRIGGTFFTGMYEYDLKFVYVDLQALQALLGLKDTVTGIEIRVKDPDSTGRAVSAIAAAIGPEYRIQDWKEINRNLFSALKLEKMVMFLVLAIIILVASFSIIGNLIMVVVEKAKEIALLKTLGSSDAQVRWLFIVQGFFIGLIGSLVGVAHGAIACLLGLKFGLPLNPDVYYIDRLPIHMELSSIVAVLGAGVAISVIATVYPAYVASRLRPVEGMRYE